MRRSKGFQIRQVRKTNNSKTRETMVSIHQKQKDSLDVSGLTQYYLDNGELLMRYFDLTDRPETTSSEKTSRSPAMTAGQSSILGLIHKSAETENHRSETELPTDITRPIPARFHDMDVHDMKKSDIYEKYKSNIHSDYVSEHYRQQNSEIRECPECGKEATVIPSDAIIFCESCGWEDRVLVDVDLPGVKDQNKDTSYFNYRKINHFNEWLAQFQAKETTDIPQEVYDKIILEFRKERRRNIANLKQTKLREILKRLGLNKYYEHIPHIINRLNGIPPPRLTPETEETLREMFRTIQTPFMKHCPSWRKNFLSYSYVLNKFCRILGKSEFLACFPLLKSREKLYEMDKVWQKICIDLGWEFHRSI